MLYFIKIQSSITVQSLRNTLISNERLHSCPHEAVSTTQLSAWGQHQPSWTLPRSPHSSDACVCDPEGGNAGSRSACLWGPPSVISLPGWLSGWFLRWVQCGRLLTPACSHACAGLSREAPAVACRAGVHPCPPWVCLESVGLTKPQGTWRDAADACPHVRTPGAEGAVQPQNEYGSLSLEIRWIEGTSFRPSIISKYIYIFQNRMKNSP